MKKILLFALCLVMLFSLCACGNEQANQNDTNSDSSVVNVDNDSSNSADNNDAVSNETNYYGTWVHEKTDAEPFSMTLTFNTDGSGECSNSGIKWSCDEATNQISIVIIYPDGSESEPTIAKLTEDNTLCWERDFTIKTTTGEFVDFDKAIFEKQ